ncbi:MULTISPECIES: FMN-dependent NADH-azoreductase [Pseudonocardia]|uniref:FMN-dependent NADH-azoreductase 1 n=2 Tax=Pseudonocardia TaxID=1847 RepID=A0A1Y2MQX1_PSEAH|nr:MULTISPECIES: NAD(P)H-dependent oxidoreductase [Pseudonocardia]OSY37624.1 FMN-dependent NADH-azoreductase 1 [Pseudonocardia autotrophica]TDN73743.1 FMN-dependent NADH-azoreductase [Pseudonocardia autotrophica]BBG04489.1 FMN-dependent NADH-azoreductase [Pseudonocardia autotrophica]GEC28245.1 FMN-dependent NADH-azoreductase [Pseudonocardia saturnea]
MSTLFRLDASIRHDGSVTRAVADTLQSTVLQELGADTRLIRRDVAADPVPADVWQTATFAPAEGRSEAQERAVRTTGELADEVLGTDVFVFAVPLYNFGVSQHFKTWVDTLIGDPRLAPGQTPLAGRPAFLVTARGGGYAPGTPRAGWDHATGWMRRILADVWNLDLDVIETELTLAEVTPQMAELRDLARAQLEESHDAARRGGRAVTLRLRSVV